MKWMWILCLFSSALFGGEWAERTLSEMTLEEKVGQLFVIPVLPPQGEEHWNQALALIQDLHIGGVITYRTDAASQVECLNFLQGKSLRPLFAFSDYEWGLGMRIEGAISFPKNEVLGRIEDPELLFAFGKEVGKEARLVGIHSILGPVVDVNNNPKNPVIGARSFGADPRQVASSALPVIRGLKASSTLSCAKHFPGHGDVEIDSHFALPQIPHDLKHLREVELYPFQKAIEGGVDMVMIGHLLVPAIDPKMPSSLSFPCITTLLRKEMGFRGLVITDALNMEALAGFGNPALLSHAAGSDLLLYGSHKGVVVDTLLRETIPAAYKAVLAAYREERLKIADLDAAVLRILLAKEKLGLPSERKVPLAGVAAALHSEEAELLLEQISRN